MKFNPIVKSSLIILLLFQIESLATPVHLRGVSKDTTVAWVEVATPIHFWWTLKSDPVLIRVDKINGSFDLNFSLDKPGFLYLKVLGAAWTIFCTPGDNVTFVIERDLINKRFSLKFEGGNSAQYNYGVEQDALRFKEYPVYSGDPEAYKASVNNWLDKNTALVNDYSIRYKTTADFNRIATIDIKYRRVYMLYGPIQSGKLKVGDVPSDYFDLIKDVSFDDDALVDHGAFRAAAVVKYINCLTPDKWNNFDVRYEVIMSNFSPKVREYLLTALIGQYARNQSQTYRTSLIKAFKDAFVMVKNPEYRAYLEESEKDYFILNQSVPDSVANTTTVVSLKDNKRLSFKELLDSFEGRAAYFDFWAHWCAPCRSDIKGSMESKAFLENEKIVYCYLSIDKDKDIDKWRKASVDDGILDNQFLIVDGQASPLAKFLKLDYIPRYILIDEAHKIKKTLAPRPVKSQFTELKTSVKDMRAKTVSFK